MDVMLSIYFLHIFISKNPDIYTQLFDDNTDLNNSYPNIDQEFANLPDVDELIEISELDREKDHDHCR